MEIEFSELYQAVQDVRIRRWLWLQLPERSQLTGDIGDYLVDSVRLRYEPRDS